MLHSPVPYASQIIVIHCHLLSFVYPKNVSNRKYENLDLAQVYIENAVMNSEKMRN